MLDEKDLQAIAALIDARLDAKLEPFKKETVALMEAYFDPRFQVLSEGQQTIREKLDVKADKVKEKDLEAEVSFLKAIVRQNTIDIANLKKA